MKPPKAELDDGNGPSDLLSGAYPCCPISYDESGICIHRFRNPYSHQRNTHKQLNPLPILEAEEVAAFLLRSKDKTISTN